MRKLSTLILWRAVFPLKNIPLKSHNSQIVSYIVYAVSFILQAFLEKRLREHNQHDVCHYIFTDSDIAVVNDLGQIFHDYPDFHLALTFRNNKQQPVNSGFIAVRGTLDGITRCVCVGYSCACLFFAF